MTEWERCSQCYAPSSITLNGLTEHTFKYMIQGNQYMDCERCGKSKNDPIHPQAKVVPVWPGYTHLLAGH